MNNNENLQSSESQNSKIKAYLLAGNKLTALEALNLFGCMRLPSRIHDLKRQGVEISSDRIVTASGKRVAQYSIRRYEGQSV